MNLNESDAYPLTDRAEVEECRRILGYPSGWSSCTYCDLPALDGHLTCGRVECNETEARYDNAAELSAARDIELWGEAPFEDD